MYQTPNGKQLVGGGSNCGWWEQLGPVGVGLVGRDEPAFDGHATLWIRHYSDYTQHCNIGQH